jgi:hypothetical protein
MESGIDEFMGDRYEAAGRNWMEHKRELKKAKRYVDFSVSRSLTVVLSADVKLGTHSILSFGRLADHRFSLSFRVHCLHTQLRSCTLPPISDAAVASRESYDESPLTPPTLFTFAFASQEVY